jgi:hypothetical protein
LSNDTCTIPREQHECPHCKKDVYRESHGTASPIPRRICWDYHIETCAVDGQLARQHKRIQDALQKTAQEFGMYSNIAEPVAPPNRSSLYLDLCFRTLTFPGLPHNRNEDGSAIDLSVIHVLSQAHRSATTKLVAAKAREREKIDKYTVACKERHLSFYPVVFESTGAMGPEAEKFMSLLVAHVGDHPALAVSRTKAHSTLLRRMAAAHTTSVGIKYDCAAKAFRFRTTATIPPRFACRAAARPSR